MKINIRGYEVLIDDEDYERVMANGPWRKHIGSNNQYFIHTSARPEHKNILLHRFILNAPSFLQVDHINNNTFDNRKCNLRLCTHQENMFNTSKRRKTKTKYKGVSRAHSLIEKWCARIWVNGSPITLGTFSTQELAHTAYCRAAKKYHGEFARFV